MDLSHVFLLHEPQLHATLDIVILTAPFPYFFDGRWSNYWGYAIPHVADLSERLSVQFPTARLMMVIPYGPTEQEEVRAECEVRSSGILHISNVYVKRVLRYSTLLIVIDSNAVYARAEEFR
jgi:hypothetical protein